MPIDGEYEPSAWNWVAKQVDQIESSGGTEGLTLQGKPVVVVTMRGRKSGMVRKAALIRVEHDGAYAIVASKGGDPQHPGWYHNIVAAPEVTLQDGTVVQDVSAPARSRAPSATSGGPAPSRPGPTTPTTNARPFSRSPVIVLEPAG